MSAADTILAQCKRVRETGRGSWIACCPAHEDRNPSMTVRELPDGMVLVHCFSGCSVESITSACGMKLGDLFPEGAKTERHGTARAHFPVLDVLLMVEHEMNVVQIVADDIAAGRQLNRDDAERVRKCRDRLREAMRLANIERHPWKPKYAR